jgi:hypothetical protein
MFMGLPDGSLVTNPPKHEKAGTSFTLKYWGPKTNKPYPKNLNFYSKYWTRPIVFGSHTN